MDIEQLKLILDFLASLAWPAVWLAIFAVVYKAALLISMDVRFVDELARLAGCDPVAEKGKNTIRALLKVGLQAHAEMLAGLQREKDEADERLRTDGA